MAKVFICYRRNDSTTKPSDFIRNLDQFVDEELIYFDGEIEPGVKWKETIKSKLEKADIILVFIGSNWESLTIEKINNGLADEVEFEIMEAHKNKKKIIPVLFDNTRMPTSLSEHEFVKVLNSSNAISINSQKREDENLKALGKQICLALHNPSYCFIRENKKSIVLSILILIITIIIGIKIIDCPRCDVFDNSSGYKIVLAPKDKSKFDIFQNKLSKSIDPSPRRIKSMDGRYQKLSSGKLQEIADKCKPDILITGDIDNCNLYIMDDRLQGFLDKNYKLSPSKFSTFNTSAENIGCIVNAFFSLKDNTENVLINPYCKNLISSLKPTIASTDTLNTLLTQTVAQIFQQQKKHNEALKMYKKISETGGLNPQMVFSQYAKVADITKNHNEAIFANTKLLNVVPDNRRNEILKKRAQHYEKVNEYDKAKEDLETVRNSIPQDAQINRDIIRLDNTIANRNAFIPTQTSPTNSASIAPAVALRVSEVIRDLEFNRQNNNQAEIDRILRNNRTLINNHPVLQAERARIEIERGNLAVDSVPQNLIRLSPQLDRVIRMQDTTNTRIRN